MSDELTARILSSSLTVVITNPISPAVQISEQPAFIVSPVPSPSPVPAVFQTGIQGAVGPQGPQGPSGSQGPQGPAGVGGISSSYAETASFAQTASYAVTSGFAQSDLRYWQLSGSNIATGSNTISGSFVVKTAIQQRPSFHVSASVVTIGTDTPYVVALGGIPRPTLYVEGATRFSGSVHFHDVGTAAAPNIVFDSTAAGCGIYSTGRDIRFTTANNSRMLIDESGRTKFGNNYIGASFSGESLLYLLADPNNAYPVVRIGAQNPWVGDFIYITDPLGRTVLYLTSSGSLAVGPVLPTERLHVSGNILASGFVSASNFIGDGAQVTGVVTASYALTSAGTITNAVSASYAATASLLLGSVQSASFAQNALTANNATNASTASYVIGSNVSGPVATATSASFASAGVGDFKGTFTGSFTGSHVGTLTGNADTATSASFASNAMTANSATTATTASYVAGANVNGTVAQATSASFASAGVGTWRGDLTGSATGTFRGTLAGNAETATSASFASAGVGTWRGDLTGSATGTFKGTLTGNADTATSASYATTASYASVAQSVLGTVTSASFANNALTANSATSASFASAGVGTWRGDISGSGTGSWKGTLTGNADTATSASFASAGVGTWRGDISGSGTGSWKGTLTGNADTATSASFANNALSANSSTSASYALTASFAQNALGTLTQTQADARYILRAGDNITGSFHITGSVTASAFSGNGANITGVVSSSFAVTASAATSLTFQPASASYAVSSSHAVTASYALSAPAGGGTVPASNVTQGTFQSGSYTFTGSLAVSGTFAVSGSGTFQSVLTLPSGTLFTGITAPSASGPNTMQVFARQKAGRMFLKTQGPSGVDQYIQSSLYENNVLVFKPNIGTTGTGTGFGGLWTSTGTVSHPALATTAPAIVNSMRRTRYTSATAANSVAGLMQNIASGQATVWRGNAAGLGGFYFFARFRDGTNTASTRMFVGLTALTTNICAAEPVSGSNSIGFGYNSTDATSNYFILRNTGTVAVIAPCSTVTARAVDNLFEVHLFAAPNAGTIHLHVDLISTTGTKTAIHNEAFSTSLLTNTAFLIPQVQKGNAAVATAQVIDIASVYVESDY